mmetsp:Transcript_35885/g.69711  ORF Transcript_35885/g.69711 Transcript_35885/m.69711 type:complete len:121 (+) Transcript_35885:287-649(+)
MTGGDFTDIPMRKAPSSASSVTSSHNNWGTEVPVVTFPAEDCDPDVGLLLELSRKRRWGLLGRPLSQANLRNVANAKPNTTATKDHVIIAPVPISPFSSSNSSYLKEVKLVLPFRLVLRT